MKIEGYDFQGPFIDLEEIENKSGVYAVTAWTLEDVKIIDVGESGELHNRLKYHDRKDQWEERLEANKAELFFYVIYVPEKKRMEIEEQLRSSIPNLCGKR